MKTKALIFLAACTMITACIGPTRAADDPSSVLKVTEATLMPRDGAGTEAAVTLKIRNDSAQPVSNPNVRCKFIDGAGKTLLTRDQVLHSEFPAQQEAVQTHIDFGTIDQTTKTVECLVVPG